MARYPPEVVQFVLELVAEWPKERPNCSDPRYRVITAEYGKTCERVMGIIQREEGTLEELATVAMKRIRNKSMNWAPQFYFGIGRNGDTPPYLVDLKLYRALVDQEARHGAATTA
jgi:hypothetical protein